MSVKRQMPIGKRTYLALPSVQSLASLCFLVQVPPQVISAPTAERQNLPVPRTRVSLWTEV